MRDVTFIPSTRFGLPTYFLSLLTNPTVANRLEKLWEFLKIWLGDEFKFGLFHLNLICFRSVMGFNQLSQWL